MHGPWKTSKVIDSFPLSEYKCSHAFLEVIFQITFNPPKISQSPKRNYFVTDDQTSQLFAPICWSFVICHKI